MLDYTVAPKLHAVLVGSTNIRMFCLGGRYFFLRILVDLMSSRIYVPKRFPISTATLISLHGAHGQNPGILQHARATSESNTSDYLFSLLRSRMYARIDLAIFKGTSPGLFLSHLLQVSLAFPAKLFCNRGILNTTFD